MHLRRRTFPLILLLSLIPILLFSYSSRRPNPKPNGNTNTNGSPKFSFTVKVLAYDRLPSLRRCLLSLATADYAGDLVHLHIYIDHFPESAPSSSPDVVVGRLGEARELLEFVDTFSWEHGEKLVHYRSSNAGLQAQWLEAWWPVSDNDFVFVVEDDLEVSTLYYKCLKALIMKYYYDPGNYSPSIYGVSLQRARFVPGKHGNKLLVDADTHIFLYQLVGTWGQLLFPKPWKEFRLWYDTNKSKGVKPYLEGMVTTGWYKKLGEKIWTPWFIKFIHSHGYYNIYLNFQHERALSVSHRDAGVNYRKSAGPDSTLLEGSLDFDFLKMHQLKNLKWYDFCFREVLPQRVVRRSDELVSLLDSMQTRRVVLVSLFGIDETVTRNLICYFERFDVRNYIFVGSNFEFLSDLVRRAHPAVYADELSKDINNMHKLSDVQSAVGGMVREVLVKAFITKKCLEHGIDVMLVDGNLLPLSDSFFQQIDASYDLVATWDAEILHVKSSAVLKRTWTHVFIKKLISDARPLESVLSISGSSLCFSKLVVDGLGDNTGLRVRKYFAVTFGTKLGYMNTTSVDKEKRFVFWDSKLGLGSLKKELRNVGMWTVDGDASCTAVVCHQS